MPGTANREHEQSAVRHAGVILLHLACVSTLGLVMTACFEPGTGTDISGPGTEPPNALFGADGGVGGCSDPVASPLSQLHVRVRTSALGGRYAPKNVGAIWVETATGGFVKTLEKWAKVRARYLVRWNAVSKGNVIDAITSATLSTHITHDREWDLTDTTECPIRPGNYRVVIEHTDQNGAGVTIELPFTKDQDAQTLVFPDAAKFHDLLLELR